MRDLLDTKDIATSGATVKVAIDGATAINPVDRDIDRTRNNNTFLKQTVSLLGAGASVLSEAVFGVRVPVYEGTLGYRLINPLNEREALSVSSIEDINKISPFHNATRNAANALITLANLPLFIVTRGAIPKFDATPPKSVLFLKAYAKSKILNVYAWHDQHKDQPTLTGSLARGAGALAYGVNKAHEYWARALRSEPVYHTLNFTAGVLAVGSLVAAGPIGWAALGGVAGITAIDAGRGIARINRVQVQQDQLSHLSSLKHSKDQIKGLEQTFDDEFKKSLGNPEQTQTISDQNDNKKTHDELNQAARKAAVTSILKDGVSLGVSAASAVVNPHGVIVDTVMSFVSWVAGTKDKLSEQESKNLIKNHTSKLEKKAGFTLDPRQSRQYDLAKAAYEHAVYAKALELAAEDHKTGKMEDGYLYKQQAEVILKRDPEFQALFHPDKLEKPSGLNSIYQGAKTSFSCFTTYINPFAKEQPSYEKTYREFSEKEEKIHQSAHQHSASPTLSTNPKSLEESRAKEEALVRHSEGVVQTTSQTVRMSEHLVEKQRDSSRSVAG